jgi:archaemetzincin
MNHTICLLKIGGIDQSILDKLKQNLGPEFKEFNITIDHLHDRVPLEEKEYNTIRKQYDASMILEKIINYMKDKEYFRVLGVIDKDIFSNNLNFVFGIANRYGKAALISITRLRESFYRESGKLYRKDTQDIFEKRTLKEAIHELGHTFGLGHCHNHCIMRFSNSLMDTDNKPKEFCHTCLGSINKYFKK